MTGDNKGTSLKELFQGMIPREVDLVQGIVISTEPLKIQMANDSKLIISRLSAVVPQHMQDLQPGDSLHLLALQNGKKYFVLGRV